MLGRPGSYSKDHLDRRRRVVECLMAHPEGLTPVQIGEKVGRDFDDAYKIQVSTVKNIFEFEDILEREPVGRVKSHGARQVWRYRLKKRNP